MPISASSTFIFVSLRLLALLELTTWPHLARFLCVSEVGLPTARGSLIGEAIRHRLLDIDVTMTCVLSVEYTVMEPGLRSLPDHQRELEPELRCSKGQR